MRRLLLAVFSTCLVLAAVPAAGSVPDRAGAAVHRAILTFTDLPAGLAGHLDAVGIADAVAFESVDAVAVTAPLAAIRSLAARTGAVSVRDERRLQLHLYDSVDQIRAQGVENEATYTVDEQTVVRPGVTGAGQTVAILDTGVWEGHPDLLGKVTSRHNFELQYAAPVLTAEQRDVYATATSGAAPVDDWGHGTHVAGIAAGSGAMSAGRENHGVAPGANLVSLKIADLHNGLPNDVGWERNAMAALDWVLRHHDDAAYGEHGIGVVNNSWGVLPNDPTNTIFGNPGRDPLGALIRQVVADGVVLVFSAGNDGPGAVHDIPNGMPEVITVAAACKRDSSCATPTSEPRITGFSSRGEQVDVAAPGADIMSTVLHASLVGGLALARGGNFGSSDTDRAQNQAFYGEADGTSMAAPHVAGVVALLLEVNPALTPAQVHQVITTTAADAGEPGFDPAFGHGMVDVFAALQAAHMLTLED